MKGLPDCSISLSPTIAGFFQSNCVNRHSRKSGFYVRSRENDLAIRFEDNCLVNFR